MHQITAVSNKVLDKFQEPMDIIGNFKAFVVSDHTDLSNHRPRFRAFYSFLQQVADDFTNAYSSSLSLLLEPVIFLFSKPNRTNNGFSVLRLLTRSLDFWNTRSIQQRFEGFNQQRFKYWKRRQFTALKPSYTDIRVKTDLTKPVVLRPSTSQVNCPTHIQYVVILRNNYIDRRQFWQLVTASQWQRWKSRRFDISNHAAFSLSLATPFSTICLSISLFVLFCSMQSFSSSLSTSLGNLKKTPASTGFFVLAMIVTSVIHCITFVLYFVIQVYQLQQLTSNTSPQTTKHLSPQVLVKTRYPEKDGLFFRKLYEQYTKPKGRSPSPSFNMPSHVCMGGIA